MAQARSATSMIDNWVSRKKNSMKNESRCFKKTLKLAKRQIQKLFMASKLLLGLIDLVGFQLPFSHETRLNANVFMDLALCGS